MGWKTSITEKRQQQKQGQSLCKYKEEGGEKKTMKMKEENLHELWNNFNFAADIDPSGPCCYNGRTIGKVTSENFPTPKKATDIYVEDDQRSQARFISSKSKPRCFTMKT